MMGKSRTGRLNLPPLSHHLGVSTVVSVESHMLSVGAVSVSSSTQS